MTGSGPLKITALRPGNYLPRNTRDPASWQIFVDLVITMCVPLVFIRRDAQAKGRPFVPWAVFSLATGSFGPLLYVITAKKRIAD